MFPQDQADNATTSNGTGVFNSEIFEVPFFDDDIYKLLVRFGFNLFFAMLLIAVCYYPRQKNRNFVFMYAMMNIVVFFICFMLKKIQLELGMALGLFAIFTIIRYRTDGIKFKDMTYLFIVIGLGVINSLSNKKTSYIELIFVNSAIFAFAMLFEQFCSTNGKPKSGNGKSVNSHSIGYNRLDLLKPGNQEQLFSDIRARTGLNVTKVEIRRYDLRKDTADITVFFDP